MNAPALDTLPAAVATTRRARRLALRAGLLALCAMPLGDAVVADPQPSVENGRRLYMVVGCYQCHGTVGQGGSAGPSIAPGPMPLEALRVFLRNSVRAMPAYPVSLLSDAGIADLHAYLQSIPPAPSPDRLPALRDLR